MDLVIQAGSRVGTVYFRDVGRQRAAELQLPWVRLCLGEGSYAPEGAFLKSSVHPRAYGNFARLLGMYGATKELSPCRKRSGD